MSAETTLAVKLALIGSGIAHSQSPRIYRALLKQPFTYDLLDIAVKDKLPSARTLISSGYRGINITAPWKKHYSEYAIDSAKRWGAVNCLSLKLDKVSATNTDATALEMLIPRYRQQYQASHWVVLGDGVMGQMMTTLLRERGESVSVLSRKNGDEVARANLLAISSSKQTKIVVNACRREMIFAGTADASWVFWDLNYAHQEQEMAVKKLGLSYFDGLSLLQTQAEHAVKFWELQA